MNATDWFIESSAARIREAIDKQDFFLANDVASEVNDQGFTDMASLLYFLIRRVEEMDAGPNDRTEIYRNLKQEQ